MLYLLNDKQLINNYRPVSLLPIFGKIFERIIFDNIYRYLDEHNLLYPNQSWFRPKDSCIYQLIEITHNIFSNGRSSEWANINTGVPQGSILGPLLSLIYINDLSEGITSNVKLFADDTSIFSTVYNINISTSNLNSDLQKVSE